MEVLCDLSLSRRRVTNLQHHHQLHRFSLPDNSSLVHNAIKKENKDGWLAWRQPHRDAKAEGAHDGDAGAGHDHAQRRPRRPAKEVLARRHCLDSHLVCSRSPELQSETTTLLASCLTTH